MNPRSSPARSALIIAAVLAVTMLAAFIRPAFAGYLTAQAPHPQSAATTWAQDISPVPQSLRMTGTGTVVAGPAAIVTGPGSDPSATAAAADLLRSAGVTRLEKLASGAPIPADVRLAVYVGGPAENPASGQALGRLGVTGPQGLPAEGYVLATGPDGHVFDAVLAGADPVGTFYAAQTLRQLLHPDQSRVHLPGVMVRDWPSEAARGVIEGFYGPPWSEADREQVLAFEGRHKLDTYVYSPKDDPYIRDQWRDPYPSAQLSQLGRLVKTAQANHVRFVFAISPGQDICYSSDQDFAALEAKAQSVYDLGVRSFAIFFDDISATLNCPSDQARFGPDASPAAAAQAFLLNRFERDFLATHPGSGPLRTVPTEYSGLSADAYKQRFAQLAAPDIRVYWTGTQVVSPAISDAEVAAARSLYQHPLEVWDNYPVNDYQLDRLFLGPVTGRAPGLAVAGAPGLVANPMLQAAPSELPLAATADMTWNAGAYDPQRSWQAALNDLGGSTAAALRTFAENNLSSPLGGTESPVLAPGTATFENQFAVGGALPEAGPLAGEFGQLAAAPSAIRAGPPGSLFAAEAGPWLDKAAQYGTGGAAAVRSLAAERAGDDTTAWQQRVILDRAAAAAAAQPQTVGAGVLEPFLNWAQAHSGVVTLASPGPGTALQPGSDITLRASVLSGRIGIRSVRFYAGGTLIGEADTAPYQVVWRNAPRELAQIVVQATDADGAVVSSAPVNLTIGVPDRALFVVNDASALTPGEQAVVQRLEYLGLAVTPETATQASAADAAGASLVVISSTMPSSEIRDKFTNVPVPLVTWKVYLYGYLGMASSWGEQFRSQQASFVTPPSPLSAGLTGTVNVYKLPDSIRWGTLAPTAIVGATLPGSPGQAVLFGYDRGVPMVSGTAPARRVGLYLSDSGLLPDLVEPQTVSVFDAAVSWALGRT